MTDFNLSYIPWWEEYSDLHPESATAITGTMPISGIAGQDTAKPPQGLHAELMEAELGDTKLPSTMIKDSDLT